MVEARRASLVLGLLSLAIGCGDGPPLDELPLRDGLRAEPAVVAALPEAARVRLAARLEAARTADSGSDPASDAADPAALIAALDDARARRAVDALIVGAVADGVGRPITAVGASTAERPLPPLEGPVATDTASLEASALAGAASGPLRGLLASSGATRLERVLGWPVGAVAIGDSVYVDASWLVALASADAQTDAGAAAAPGGGAGQAASRAGAIAPVTPAAVSVSNSYDAGTYSPPPPPPPSSSSSSSFWDACSASCDATGAASDSCDSTDNSDSSSCSGSTDDGSGDACSTPPDDGSCRISPGPRSGPSTLLWVVMPLGFLIGRRR